MSDAAGPTCPCGHPAPYEACCGRLHRGDRHAATAEQLMRSRYCAFVVGDVAYLAATWDDATRPRRIHLDPDRTWTGLEVLATERGGMLDHDGTVEFVAHHRDGDGDHAHHELSRFRRHEGRWRYVDALR